VYGQLQDEYRQYWCIYGQYWCMSTYFDDDDDHVDGSRLHL
jgi:hypothetical protein